MGARSARRRRSLERLPAAARPTTALLLGLVTRFPATTLDPLRLTLADHRFLNGRYGPARASYAAIRGADWNGVGRLMTDWIDFKSGRYAVGWPDYPGKGMPEGLVPFTTVEPPVHVAEPDRPEELVTRLGLVPWTPASPSEARILIWFDWKASIGGEVLAARIVRAFLRATGRRAVLAVDPRLVTYLDTSFPECVVISKEAELASAARSCRSYLMARDVLRQVVKTEADFKAIRAEPFRVAKAHLPARYGSGSNMAFTWKTTNLFQGAYRNVSITELAVALGRLDGTFHCAQHGVSRDERKALEAELGARVTFETIDPSGAIETFASQLAAMDALITIDNSALHIAGACGIPTVGLISIPAYWAWPMSGIDSRWYSSVHLLHQVEAGYWTSVLDALPDALAALKDRPMTAGG